MSVHFADHDVTLHLGDVRDVLRTLPDESVHCVVTSPPYYGLRDYGVADQIGLEPTPADYVETLRTVLAECRRILRADGTLWLNLGDSYSGKANAGATFDRHRGHGHKAGIIAPQKNTTAHAPYKSMLGMPWRVAFALIDDGWTLRNDIIWTKPNAMPESIDDRLSCRYEHVFLLTRSKRYYFDLEAIKIPSTGQVAGNTASAQAAYGAAGGTTRSERRFGGNPTSTLTSAHPTRNPGDVWTIPTAPYPGAHFATMPPALARRCILAGCPEGGTVLDPFAGSGTTLMAARHLGRKSIGVELNAEYADLSVDRLGATPLDFLAAAANE